MVTTSEAETMAAARDMAATLAAGDVVLLSGDLGAGKTAFVRGLAEGLGIDPDEVSSPTFALVHEYRGGRLPLFHVDLYRLGQTEIAEIGLDERAAEQGILAIEWPERLMRVIPGALTVQLRAIDGDTRELTVDRLSNGSSDHSSNHSSNHQSQIKDHQ